MEYHHICSVKPATVTRQETAFLVMVCGTNVSADVQTVVEWQVPYQNGQWFVMGTSTTSGDMERLQKECQVPKDDHEDRQTGKFLQGKQNMGGHLIEKHQPLACLLWEPLG